MALHSRFINVDTIGLPLAAPEVCHDELLPVNDEEWGRGRAVPSEPLYTTSFSHITSLGRFARTCQAAHMLSKVISHREGKLKASQTNPDLLHEARSLHRALSALQLSIEQSAGANSKLGFKSSLSASLAICVCARYLLHGLYGCPEAPGAASRERLSLEAEMQLLSIEGLRTLASSTVPRLTRLPSECPLLARCFYVSANACAWFIREDHEPEMQGSLGHIVSGLQRLGKRWTVAGKCRPMTFSKAEANIKLGEYIALLEKGGITKLIPLQVQTKHDEA